MVLLAAICGEAVLLGSEVLIEELAKPAGGIRVREGREIVKTCLHVYCDVVNLRLTTNML